MSVDVWVRKTSFFEGLRPETLDRLAAIAEEQRHPADTMLFSEGDPASHLYIVAEGEVELTYIIHSRSPITMTVAKLQPGGVFGWSSLVGNQEFFGNARAMVDTRVWRFPAPGVLSILDDDPQAGYLVMTRMTRLVASRLRDVRTEIRWFLSSL